MTRNEIKDLIIDEARDKVAGLSARDLARKGEVTCKLIRDGTPLDIMSDYFANKAVLSDDDFVCIEQINDTAIDDYNAPLRVGMLDGVIDLLACDRFDLGEKGRRYIDPIYFNIKSDITPDENCEYMPIAYYFDFKVHLAELVIDYIEDDCDCSFEEYFSNQIRDYITFQVTKITPFFSECIDRKARRFNDD